jgi:hypothetical protein
MGTKCEQHTHTRRLPHSVEHWFGRFQTNFARKHTNSLQIHQECQRRSLGLAQWRSHSALGVSSRDQGGSQPGPILGELHRHRPGRLLPQQLHQRALQALPELGVVLKQAAVDGDDRPPLVAGDGPPDLSEDPDDPCRGQPCRPGGDDVADLHDHLPRLQGCVLDLEVVCQFLGHDSQIGRVIVVHRGDIRSPANLVSICLVGLCMCAS